MHVTRDEANGGHCESPAAVTESSSCCVHSSHLQRRTRYADPALPVQNVTNIRSERRSLPASDAVRFGKLQHAVLTGYSLHSVHNDLEPTLFIELVQELLSQE